MFSNVNRHLELTTPLMDEALRTMKNFFKSKKPAIKLAAVKTAVELASEQQEAVIPDLIKLLNDPVKVVREEAKRALELLAGIYCWFEPDNSLAPIPLSSTH